MNAWGRRICGVGVFLVCAWGGFCGDAPAKKQPTKQKVIDVLTETYVRVEAYDGDGKFTVVVAERAPKFLQKEAGEKMTVCLYGVELPLEGQKFGPEVRSLIQLLLLGRDVVLIPQIKLEDGTFACKMISSETKTKYSSQKRKVTFIDDEQYDCATFFASNGLAWNTLDLNKLTDPAASEYETALVSQVKRAQFRKVNIWSEMAPVAPWDFRKQQQEKAAPVGVDGAADAAGAKPKDGEPAKPAEPAPTPEEPTVW